jgi:diguanylate cyclase (GGDEF)-like protein
MKVLIVDDTLSMLMATSAMVKANGHAVVTARNGREAVEVFERELPDLVLLDVIMPEMDGYATAESIRQLSGEHWIPIIFLSSLINDKDIATGIAAGGDDYLTKPVSQTLLASKLLAMQRIADMRARLVNVSHELESANRRLQSIVHQDGLTGIANRRHFDAMLTHEWGRSTRNGKPLGLVLIDVDHFKTYNDRNGHLGGDECLIKVARTLTLSANRSTDIVARYGGEEFAIVLPDTPLEGVHLVGERMRAAVEALHIPYNAPASFKEVTISLGGAATIPSENMSPQTLIEMADHALYEAKRKGRNGVVVAGYPECAAA